MLLCVFLFCKSLWYFCNIVDIASPNNTMKKMRGCTKGMMKTNNKKINLKMNMESVHHDRSHISCRFWTFFDETLDTGRSALYMNVIIMIGMSRRLRTLPEPTPEPPCGWAEVFVTLGSTGLSWHGPTVGNTCCACAFSEKKKKKNPPPPGPAHRSLPYPEMRPPAPLSPPVSCLSLSFPGPSVHHCGRLGN